MVMLAHVQFTNNTGGPATLYYKHQNQFRGATQDIPAGGTGPAIDGTLLTVDFQTLGQHYSTDLSRYLPKGVWVENESPYRLAAVLSHGRIDLVVADNTGKVVDTFPATMV